MELTFIDDTQKVSQEQQTEITEILEVAANKLGLAADTEMSITFMDNQGIQEINRDYRDKDQPTDVISFANEETAPEELAIDFGELDLEIPRDIGDIMISIERAAEQAEEYGHSYQRELGFLAVHGFLHLNGYDHMTEEDEKEMFGLQKEILDAYGLQR